MADQKKLEDYMKDLNAYAKDDAHQKRRDYEASFKKQFVFPWTKVIFFGLMSVGVFNGPLKDFAATLAAHPYVRSLAMAGSKYVGVTIKLPPEGASNGQAVPANPVQNQGQSEQSSWSLQAPELPKALDGEGGEAVAAAPRPESDMVKVEGRWMKRTPDNIYIIDGRRVLYIDQRSRR